MSPAAAAAPRAREWRSRLRRGRRAHHTRPLGERLTDLYILLWIVAIYGGTLAVTLRQHLAATAGAPRTNAERWWLGAAALLGGGGLAWKGLRSLGPLLATPAEQAWGVATPIERRAWLLPRFALLVAASAAAAGVAAGAVALATVTGGSPGSAVLAGAAWGALAAAAAVVAQRPPGGRWPALPGAALLAAGAAAAAAVVVAHYGGRLLPTPTAAIGLPTALVGAPLAAAALALASRALPALDIAALSAGAQLATVAMTATIWVDPALLSRFLEVRRWRRVARVRARPLTSWPGGRVPALLWVELRRVARRPSAIAVWGALALAQYAVAVVAPSAAGVTRVIGAYLAAGRFAGGLRVVARSQGLRRALGGDEWTLRLSHVVLPALAALLWWAVTAPAAAALAGAAGAGGAAAGAGALLLPLGAVAAAYRAATRGPISYGSAVFETPFGLFPVELVISLARGPDLLAAVLLLQVLLTR